MTVSFQSNASADGRKYEETCIMSLEMHGFEIVNHGVRINDCGVQIDIEAVNPYGLHALFECKGGMQRGTKPGGLKSSDNVRKAIGSAASLSRSVSHTGGKYTPLIVMTPYLMTKKQHIFTQLAVLPTEIMADVVDDRDSTSLKMWANMDYYAKEAYLKDYALLGFRLFSNEHWRIPGLASKYFQDLNIRQESLYEFATITNVDRY